jgi:hypothetical protein
MIFSGVSIVPIFGESGALARPWEETDMEYRVTAELPPCVGLDWLQAEAKRRRHELDVALLSGAQSPIFFAPQGQNVPASFTSKIREGSPAVEML